MCANKSGLKIPQKNVTYHLKPAMKPSISPNLKVIEERTSQYDLDCVSAPTEADKREFLISRIRLHGCGVPYNDYFTPLMRVGFMFLLLCDCLHYLRGISLANPTKVH